jgi:hypothetical protein
MNEELFLPWTNARRKLGKPSSKSARCWGGSHPAPPHASNQLQMLDLCVFGVTKKLIPRVNKLDNKFNVPPGRMISILTGFHRAVYPSMTTMYFQNAGISLMDADRVICCKITLGTVRCVINRAGLEILTSVLEPSEEEHSSDDDDLDEKAYWEMTERLLYSE